MNLILAFLMQFTQQNLLILAAKGFRERNMNYQEMSDSQINGLVMDLISNGQQYHKTTQSSAIALIRQIEEVQLGEHVTVEEVTSLFDPCNSWADAGQIAEDNEIGVLKVLNGWCATNDHAKHEGVFFVDPNPRRAICIVFLMMKGGE